MATRTGLIVKIDGIDGCGKTTLIENLHKRYTPTLRVTTTREFGSEEDTRVIDKEQSGTVSRMLYELALNPRLKFDLVERQLAMAIAARRQNRLVLPLLREEYDLILSDRSSLSSYSYGRELGGTFHTFLQWALEPVLTEDWILWIDVDPKTAFQRTLRNTAFVLERCSEDAVEMQGLTHQVAVREIFERLFERRKNVIRLDGTLGILELTEAAGSHIDKILSRTM